MPLAWGKPMNWDQIEVKWAAMARRVRSDLPQNVTATSEQKPAAATPRAVSEQARVEVSVVRAG